MATLSAAIVKHRVASMAEVEEALARQVLYGGDLVTNLLETASVSEEQLATVIGATRGLQGAPPGELPRANANTLRLIPTDLANRHSIYPLEEHPGELVVATSEPLPSDVENDLSFALGVTIAQLAAPLVRVRQAISRDYGIPLERRFERLLAKLEGHTPPPSGNNRQVSGSTLKLPRPESLPPQAYPPRVQLPAAPIPVTSEAGDRTLLHSSPLATPGETAAVPSKQRTASVRPTQQWSLREEDAGTRKITEPSLTAVSAPPSQPAPLSSKQLGGLALAAPSDPSQRKSGRPHRGPYTTAMARKDLDEATSRDEVMRSFFDFTAQYFEYSVLFTVHSDLAEGWDAHGPGADRSEVARIGVPLDLPGSLTDATHAGTFRLGSLGADSVDASLARDLRRPTGPRILLLPISVRNRCVLLLYGDHGEDDVELDSVGEVIAFAGLVSAALERVILRRKLAARRAVAIRSAVESLPQPLVERGKREDLPTMRQRAETLTQALSTKHGTPTRRSTAPATPAARTRADDTMPTPAMLPEVRASWTAPQQPAAATSSGKSNKESFPTAPRGRHTVPGLAPRRHTARGVAPPPTPSPPAAAVDDTPDISIESTEIDDDAWDTYEALDENGAPLAPASRSVHHEARAPRRRHSSQEANLPSVIVDTGSDIQVLIDRLVEGDENAATQLVQLGESAIGELVARFPGPVTIEPRRIDAAQPSRCGPLLDVLARIGRPAEPYLLVRSADADAHVRAWVTRLLGEIRGPDSARIIARRFTDEDERVRRAALAAARMLQRDKESRKSLRDSLLKTANDEETPPGTRLAMIAALAGVRDSKAVPALIPLLADSNNQVVEATEAALLVLTRRQFGVDIGSWTQWWDDNGHRHRIEWLIDSLTSVDQEIRAAAGDELKTITKEYFGYYDDLPRKERGEAQQRYREWWESRGKAMFS